MLIFLLWIYIFFTTVCCWIFIFSKIYSEKFIYLNWKISHVNKIFFAILVFFTILWFILIFSIDFNSKVKLDENNINETLHY